MNTNKTYLIFLPFLLLTCCNFAATILTRLLFPASSDSLSSQLFLSFIYAIAAIILFGIWFYKQIFSTAAQGFSLSSKNWIGLLLAALGTFWIISCTLGVLSWFFPEAFSAYNESLNKLGFSTNVLSWVYSIFLAPICEELCFRGLTLHYTRQHMTFFKANLLQAVLFALIHMNLIQMCYALVLGLTLGYVYRFYGQIKACIGFHMLFNFFNIPMLFLYQSLPISGIIVYLSFLLCGFLIFLISIKYFFPKMTKEIES